MEQSNIGEKISLFDLEKLENDKKYDIDPRKFYSTTYKLYMPLLSPYTKDYCICLKVIPKWCWNLIVEDATSYMYSRNYFDNLLVRHLTSIIKGIPPYDIVVV